MSEKLTATPAGMKWCAEHKQWEHIRLEGDIHMAVSQWHHHYQAHIKTICAMISNQKCCDCINPAAIVTDGLETKFYCRHHWDWRSREQEYIDMQFHEVNDPLTDEKKKTFGIEEAQ